MESATPIPSGEHVLDASTTYASDARGHGWSQGVTVDAFLASSAYATILDVLRSVRVHP